MKKLKAGFPLAEGNSPWPVQEAPRQTFCLIQTLLAHPIPSMSLPVPSI